MTMHPHEVQLKFFKSPQLKKVNPSQVRFPRQAGKAARMD